MTSDPSCVSSPSASFCSSLVRAPFLSPSLLNRTTAYLTNPSESSFRAYLTELSFRHHLSRLDRLDDGADDVPFREVSAPHPRANQHPLSLEITPLLHFGSRASVSIRTPKHVFHSFAVFTVATMLPTAKSSPRNNSSISSVITDSWYIGAFGKWWRGGIIEAWYQDVVARSSDEESWTSGILSLTTIDMRHESSGTSIRSTFYHPRRIRTRLDFKAFLCRPVGLPYPNLVEVLRPNYEIVKGLLNKQIHCPVAALRPSPNQLLCHCTHRAHR